MPAFDRGVTCPFARLGVARRPTMKKCSVLEDEEKTSLNRCGDPQRQRLACVRTMLFLFTAVARDFLIYSSFFRTSMFKTTHWIHISIQIYCRLFFLSLSRRFLLYPCEYITQDKAYITSAVRSQDMKSQKSCTNVYEDFPSSLEHDQFHWFVVVLVIEDAVGLPLLVEPVSTGLVWW